MSIPREIESNAAEGEIETPCNAAALLQAFDALASVSEDFFAEGRGDAPAQPRKDLWRAVRTLPAPCACDDGVGMRAVPAQCRPDLLAYRYGTP